MISMQGNHFNAFCRGLKLIELAVGLRIITLQTGRSC